MFAPSKIGLGIAAFLAGAVGYRFSVSRLPASPSSQPAPMVQPAEMVRQKQALTNLREDWRKYGALERLSAAELLNLWPQFPEDGETRRVILLRLAELDPLAALREAARENVRMAREVLEVAEASEKLGQYASADLLELLEQVPWPRFRRDLNERLIWAVTRRHDAGKVMALARGLPYTARKESLKDAAEFFGKERPDLLHEFLTLPPAEIPGSCLRWNEEAADPQSAQALLRERIAILAQFPRVPKIGEHLRHAISALSSGDYEAALDEAAKWGLPDVDRQIRDSLLREKIQSSGDFADSLEGLTLMQRRDLIRDCSYRADNIFLADQLIQTLTDPAEKAAAIDAALARGWDDQDLIKLKWLQSFSVGALPRGRSQDVLKEIGKKNPREALEAATGLLEGWAVGFVRNSILTNWLKEEREEAQRWLLEQPDREGLAEAAQPLIEQQISQFKTWEQAADFIRSWPGRDGMATALEMARKANLADAGTIGNLALELLGTEHVSFEMQETFQAWAKVDAGGLLDSATQSTGRIPGVAAAALLTHLVQHDPATAQQLWTQYAQTESHPNMREAVLDIFLKHWVAVDAPAAALWLDSLQDPELDEGAGIWEVAYQWSEQDPKAAEAWAESLPPKLRDKALYHIGGNTETPAEAARLFSGIQDAKQRRDALAGHLEYWHRDDPKAATAFLQSLPLAAEEREAILKQIQKENTW